MLRIGSHVSFKKPGYLLGAAEESIANQANAMMIYLGAPQNTVRADVSSYQLKEYKSRYGSAIPAPMIVVHAPYIINLASVTNSAFARSFLIDEIRRMNYIGALYLVVHPGSSTGAPSKKVAEETLIQNVKTILESTRDVTILLETMSGKGGELGSSFAELAHYVNAINSPRVGVCLDTCHIWDAGYDVVTQLPSITAELEKLNLLNKIPVLHINDSKNPRGSHKDRHANIGDGMIGLEALRHIVHDKHFAKAIKILETPITSPGIYAKEIALLKAQSPL